MPTIFIHDEPIQLPTPKKQGDILSISESEALNNLWLNRYISRLKYWSRRNSTASFDEVMIQSQIIIDTFSFDADATGLESEAAELAREIIERHLNANNIPVPLNLDPHIKALLQQKPEIYDMAMERLEIKQRVGSEVLERTSVSASSSASA